ncbi:MAG: acyl-CoA dehydrogenase family protein, partial [Sandaracinobacteroides sp.]
MNFDLTETQALLKATVERFASEAHGHDLEKRRLQRASPGGFARTNWTALAELGVTALPFAEADGGLGGGPVETIAVAEAMGHSLATEPFTECLVPAAALIGGLSGALRADLST